jgi:hypothetical protein
MALVAKGSEIIGRKKLVDAQFDMEVTSKNRLYFENSKRMVVRTWR